MTSAREIFIDLLPDRKKQSVMRWLLHLPTKDVNIAVIDMHAPYLEALQEVLPGVCVVIDKWHVLKQVNEIVETVRKEVRGTLSERQRRTLMHDRFLLLRRRRDLTASELLILDAWLLQFKRLSAVYWRKEEFFEIYNAKNEDEAWGQYMAWHDRVAESGVYDAFLSFFLTIETWGTFVFNYFSHRYTGGFVEGANSLIRSQERAGRGYSFAVLRARMLYAEPLCRRTKRSPKVSPDVCEATCVDDRLLDGALSTQDTLPCTP
jgi:transposase